MGRHGGGSRSGGGGGGSHGGGSRGGGSAKTSAKPFAGCYNRGYYHKGVYHSCYTNCEKYGTSKGRLIGQLLTILFMVVCMLPLLVLVGSMAVEVGSKVDGDPDRIRIEDRLDLLTSEEEQRTLALFENVYEASGMPVTLYTDDMAWQDKYSSIEVYSEELYYAMGIEEDAMVILFTYDGSFEWIYDMYCGDDTVACLSDPAFETLLEEFRKGMAGQNLCNALEHAFGSVMDDFATSSVDWGLIGIVVVMAGIFGVIVWFAAVRPYLKERKAYLYFKEHPEEAGQEQLLVKPQCPSCGAHNSNHKEVCEYCGTVLKL